MAGERCPSSAGASLVASLTVDLDPLPIRGGDGTLATTYPLGAPAARRRLSSGRSDWSASDPSVIRSTMLYENTYRHTDETHDERASGPCDPDDCDPPPAPRRQARRTDTSFSRRVVLGSSTGFIAQWHAPLWQSLSFRAMHQPVGCTASLSADTCCSESSETRRCAMPRTSEPVERPAPS